LSNVVRHAFPERPPGRCDLRLHLDVLGEALRATVIDNGPPFDPVRFKPTPVASSLSESELGGWGIRLVGEMVDEMRYWRSDECNCLELVVRPQAGPDRLGSHVHEEQREWRGSVEIREIEKGDGLRHLALSGRLDLAGTQAIETQFAALTSGAKQTAIVDVREVTFLASLGLRMLVSSARTLVKSGAKLVVLGPRPAVRLVLETAGLAAILPIAANDAEAIALATS
jgi:anti-anti-sigma factor